MSTDQTTPPPVGSALPGTVEAAADLDPDEDLTADPDGDRAAGLDEHTPAAGRDSLTTGPGSPAAEPGMPTGGPTVRPPGADSARHPVGSSWQAEASGDLVAMSFPGARRIAGWLFWVVFPLLCIATIHTAVTSTVHHLGDKPVGIRGTFVVQPRSCNQGFCSFGGLFSSDDGTIKNLPLLGDPRWRTAEVHRVTYDPRSVEVTALPGHWNPTPTVMAIIGALAYLGTIGYFVRQRRRSSRHHRSAAAEPDPVPTG
jgi:hypothetical protein